MHLKRVTKKFMSQIKEISSSKCFGGFQKVFEHQSEELKCKMKFTIFMPSTANESGIKLPIVYFTSGLSSSEEMLITKSGFQRYAEQYKLVVAGPDVSPRETGIPGEDDDRYVGTGASFYVDATREPWNKHYRMYSYVTEELRRIVDENFKFVDGNRVGITGHSMGGHGALMFFLRKPQIYKAVSAFAPLCTVVGRTADSPVEKALTEYLGADKTSWLQYDACELVLSGPRKDVTILIDQGDQDHWYDELQPEKFVKACEQAGQPIQYNERSGYDHSWYFVSTFIGNHMEHFHKALYR